ncbi:hypothetical protein BGX29_011958 [Mortierella sp. GBA35]|nr:hypothetical protein BGX29_011958 [Mortierella sp. GBA35]
MPPPKDLKVIIAGAGIAGLTLAVLLERAHIDYELFERAQAVRSLGTAPSIDPSVMPSSSPVYMGKRFESLVQNDKGITVTFADKSTIHGTILVGADGAYSAVRKNLNERLDQQAGQLPVSDKEEFPCSSIYLVGQTTCLLLMEKFPYLKNEFSIQDAVVLSNYLYTMRDTTPRNYYQRIRAIPPGTCPIRSTGLRYQHTSEGFRELFRKRLINGFIPFMVKYIPRNRIFKVYSYRPQVAFLPLVPDRGSVKAFPQGSLYLNERAEE